MALTLSIPAFATELDSSPAYDNDEGDYGIGINGKYNAAEEPEIKVSVDIIWEKMEFTYTGGEKSGWDAEHHTYSAEGEGSWSENKPALTVKNHSEAGITATFEFNPSDGVETVGTFYAKDDADYIALDADEQAISLVSAIGTVRSEDEATDETPAGVIYFGVSGASVSEDTRLGSIVVTLTAEKIEYTVVTTEEELYEAMMNGGYIRLGNNITFSGDYIYIDEAGDDITLDLNGFVITGYIGLQYCALTVTDRIGTGGIDGRSAPAIVALSSTLSIGGGSFVSDYYYSVYVESGYLDISGGTFCGNMYSMVSDSGTADITGGTFNSTVGNAGSMTIAGGSIDCGYGVAVENYGQLNISGGSIAGALVNEGSYDITVTGGSFDRDPSDYVNPVEYTVTESDGVYTVDVNTSGVPTVNTALALKQALEAGGNVILGSSFELTNNFEISADVTRTLDLNGKTLTGTLEISGGTLTVKDSVGTGAITAVDGKALRVYSSATLNIEGGTFSGISSYSEVNISGGNFIGPDTLDMYDGAKLTMTGGTVVAESDALYVSGEAEISGGSFTGTVRANTARGTLTIKGGTFSQDPYAYVNLSEYTVTESDGVYTVDVNTSGVVIVNTADALKQVLEAGGEVTLGRNIEILIDGNDLLQLDSDVTRTLDLNGYSLTGSIRLEAGTLTVKDNGDTSATEGVNFQMYADCVLTIESGTYGYITASHGTLNISGGSFGGSGIAVLGDANATITGGTFNTTGTYVLNLVGTANISGGNFTGTVSVSGGGELTITDGTFINTDDLVLVADGGTANVSGGDFTGDIYVRGESDTLTISGGTFNGSFSGLFENALTIKGGTFSVDVTSYIDTENYTVTESDGKYTVTAKTAE